MSEYALTIRQPSPDALCCPGHTRHWFTIKGEVGNRVDYEVNTTLTPEGWRRCRVCRDEQSRSAYLRRKDAR